MAQLCALISRPLYQSWWTLKVAMETQPDGSTHCLMVSVKGSKVRIESHSRKWWKLMCVKRHAGGLSLERGLFFWTRSSSPAWECRSIWPPSYPTYSTLPPSPLPPLCCLENGSPTFETQPVAFWGLTFTKWAYSLNTFHRSWYSSSCLHGTLNTMTAYIQRCWCSTALTSPFVSNVIAVVTAVTSFCQSCLVAPLTNNGNEISPFPASTMLHRCTVCGLCGCRRACACQAIWHLHLKSPSLEILTTLPYIALQPDGQK